ncbi:unnamed protein product [Vitrella brassicaformis CCMP3155]|uniref:C2H2-type domain-containing protein n=2 Tax=Vitrella brassicaformis TaxID=1169539 RepID=A0A0G4E9W0_VITBC|nr:unnamed protein product [Vitrella brassicaformis CCMP3155]|mmetsp:Transcript_48166/g.120590  ORF Transcript_48166/g.120590 Transcript_48166/m.120590 type:complete len:363 (+) Transcript_48166:90-1178(+)|eukprot:CEL91989.1 unnamed protein product [Vitrella brassicaformis CCMP3155]
MSRGVFQPVGQVRLTNVAVVRYKTHGKRFEVACYKNKVLNYRSGIEKDLDEVLQIRAVFSNVGKGQYANKDDVQMAFGTTDEDTVCRLILEKGEIQVSEKERHHVQDSLLKDIVGIVAEKCVNLKTGLPLTTNMVESALKDLGYSVKQNEPAKKQALKAIDMLVTQMPESIARAKMRLQITCDATHRDKVHETLAALEAVIETETESGGYSVVFCCEPSHYRQLDHMVLKELAPPGSLQLLSSNAGATGISKPPARPLRGRHKEPDNNQQEAATRSSAPAGDTAASDHQPASRGEGDNETTRQKFTCSTCQVGFQEAPEYRSHCKGEWHGFNLKRKVKKLPPVSEGEFAELSLDINLYLAVE